MTEQKGKNGQFYGEKKANLILLEQAEELFPGLFKSNLFGMGICSEDEKYYLKVNDEYLRLTGYFREEIIGQSAKELSLWDTPGSTKTGTKKEGVEGHNSQKESRYRTRSGEIRDALIFVERLIIVDQKCLFFILIDISEKVAEETKVRESEERYRQLVESSPDLITIQSKGKITYINPAGLNLLGANSAEEIIGKPVLDIVPDHFQDIARATLINVEKGSEFLQEQQILRLDGKLIDVETTGIPIIYQGETAAQIIMRDISKYKRDEKERNPFFTITLDLLCITGRDGFFKQLNPAFEKILGFTNAELLARPFIDFVHPDDKAATLAEMSKLDQGITTINFENRYSCKDGSYKWLLWSSTPDTTEPVIYATARDVTQYKQLETDLQGKNEELIAQNIKVQEANRMKSEFLANTSHEIRTPLNGVIGMTGLLLETELAPEQRAYAEVIRQSGENLLSIINDILDFSKIEAGKLQFETIDFDLVNTIEETTSLLAERAQSRGLELISAVDKDVPTQLRGDPFRIGQILLNLVGNAIKFTEKGEVFLHVKFLEEDHTHCLLHFEVKDTGIGISPENQASLFQPFIQADASNTRKYGGTGLGLVISNQLTNLMGGQIKVDSYPGKGSTFSFEIRLEKQLSESHSIPFTRHDPLGLHVLVVDDNSTNRTILNKQLNNWGMSCHSVDSGPRALESLQTASKLGEPYNLAILDMQMPEMNGLELARLIKSDPSLDNVKLVLLTSVIHHGITEEAREIGFSSCLTKPARQSELYKSLTSAMAVNPLITRNRQDTSAVQIKKAREQIQGRILIAEDNPINQLVARGIVEAGGYKADVVDNGLKALEAIGHTSYLAILMDCQMPEMDGYTATKEIRKLEGSERHIPIIAMTANAQSGTREKCLVAGMDDYVSKPVKKEELYALLERWLFLSIDPILSLNKMDNKNLDLSILENLRSIQVEGMPDILTKVVELFEEDTPKRFKALKEEVLVSDTLTIERMAHNLKGSCANMGAFKMVKLCIDLENFASEKNMEKVRELIDQLEIEYNIVLTTIHSSLFRAPVK